MHVVGKAVTFSQEIPDETLIKMLRNLYVGHEHRRMLLDLNWKILNNEVMSCINDGEAKGFICIENN